MKFFFARNVALYGLYTTQAELDKKLRDDACVYTVHTY